MNGLFNKFKARPAKFGFVALAIAILGSLFGVLAYVRATDAAGFGTVAGRILVGLVAFLIIASAISFFMYQMGMSDAKNCNTESPKAQSGTFGFIELAIVIVVLLVAFVAYVIGTNSAGFGAVAGLILVGFAAFLGIMSAISFIMNKLGMSDAKQAFGLPAGSVRAVLTIAFIVLVAVLSGYLVTSSGGKSPFSKELIVLDTCLTEDEAKDFLLGKPTPDGMIQRIPAAQYAASIAYSCPDGATAAAKDAVDKQKISFKAKYDAAVRAKTAASDVMKATTNKNAAADDEANAAKAVVKATEEANASTEAAAKAAGTEKAAAEKMAVDAAANITKKISEKIEASKKATAATEKKTAVDLEAQVAKDADNAAQDQLKLDDAAVKKTKLFDIVLFPKIDTKLAEDVSKQILTMLTTILAAMIGFYFAASTGDSDATGSRKSAAAMKLGGMLFAIDIAGIEKKADGLPKANATPAATAQAEALKKKLMEVKDVLFRAKECLDSAASSADQLEIAALAAEKAVASLRVTEGDIAAARGAQAARAADENAGRAEAATKLAAVLKDVPDRIAKLRGRSNALAGETGKLAEAVKDPAPAEGVEQQFKEAQQLVKELAPVAKIVDDAVSQQQSPATTAEQLNAAADQASAAASLLAGLESRIGAVEQFVRDHVA